MSTTLQKCCLLVPLCLVALTACTPSAQTRETSDRIVSANAVASRVNSSGLSSFTQAAVDALSSQASQLGRQSLVDTLHRRATSGDRTQAWRLAQAETLFDWAEDLGRTDASLYLAAARAADSVLRSTPEDGELDQRQLAQSIYSVSVSEWIRLSGRDWRELVDGQTMRGKGGGFVLRPLVSHGTEHWPQVFDELILTDRLDVSGMRDRYRVNGYGASVIAVRDQLDASPPRIEFCVPPEGMIVPAAITLDFSQGERVGVHFWNTDRYDAVRLAGKSIPLSVDTTAPIAELFGRTNLARAGRDGLGNTAKYIHRIGIYAHEPYDPNKIPVLMVHGLWNSPHTWRDMLNELRADPVLRKQYQFWMFYYPTGLPIPRSAAYLREHLKLTKRHFDPEGTDPKMSRMVLIGHSMGGLLSKAVVQSSGDRMWDSLHPVSFADLMPPEGVREHLEEVFFYQADPDIERVVFIATPHRGSPLAVSPIGAIGGASVRLPEEFEAVDDWLLSQGQMLEVSNAYQTRRGVPTSIDDLKPGAPHLTAYLETPIRSGVSTHAIIGNQVAGSDGVVPVSSARLGTESSELVIPSGHEAHQHPDAIQEVKRILRLHLKASEIALQP